MYLSGVSSGADRGRGVVSGCSPGQALVELLREERHEGREEPQPHVHARVEGAAGGLFGTFVTVTEHWLYTLLCCVCIHIRTYTYVCQGLFMIIPPKPYFSKAPTRNYYWKNSVHAQPAVNIDNLPWEIICTCAQSKPTENPETE